MPSVIKHILSGFCILAVMATLSSCENSRAEIAAVTSRKIGIETADDVTILYSLGAQTKAKITAPLMLRHVEEAPYLEFPKTLKSVFFDDSLHEESHLSAHYAKYTENDSKVFLKDSVVVFNNLGDTLYCQELYWDRHLPGHEFYTDKPVRVRTRTQIINGTGLDAPQDFKSWHILNVQGIVKVPAADLP